MVPPQTFGSGEYNATPSHALPALSFNGTGYICQTCGHLEVNLDNNPFGELCPKCVQVALHDLHVPHMVKISDHLDEIDIALEPTVHIANSKARNEKTTVILRKR